METKQVGLKKIFRIFLRTHHTMMRCEFDHKGFSELSNPEILFLLHSRSHKNGLSQKQIADIMGVSPPSVAVSLKRMEKAGLVKKEMDQKDLRKNIIRLTEKGNSLTNECKLADQAVYDQIIKGFSQEELLALEGFFLRMIANMEQLGAKLPIDIKAGDKND